jgi:predicted nucleotidyltransferase
MGAGVEEIEARVRAALEPIDALRVAYLFGSRVRGDARPDSDLDVAVVFADGANERERECARRAVISALTDALGALGERADVVDLATADSAVAFRALQGRLVLARTDTDRVRIEVRVGRRFDDDAPKRALFRRAARDAVARLARPAPGTRGA